MDSNQMTFLGVRVGHFPVYETQYTIDSHNLQLLTTPHFYEGMNFSSFSFFHLS